MLNKFHIVLPQHLFFVLLAVCVALSYAAAQDQDMYTGGSEGDRAALEALYNATEGSKWINSEGWNTDMPLGEWYGVTTDTYSGRVTRLSLSENQLSGKIPAELGGLVKLEELYLNDNRLTGQIPSELGNLNILKSLWLQDNQLEGEIPSELADASAPRWLHLSNNWLSGQIPWSRGQTLFDDTSPAELALWGNQLEGEIPVYFRAAVERAVLRDLYAKTDGDNWTNKDNWFDSSVLLSDWHGVTLDAAGRVRDLDLSGNGLGRNVPSGLGFLSDLENLDLSDNYGLAGALPLSLMNLSNLLTLNISGTNLCAPAIFEGWLNSEIIIFQGKICEEISVSFEASGYTMVEGDSVRISVTLSADPKRTVEIPFTIDRTSTAGNDDYSIPENLIFASGEYEKSFIITAANDLLVEESETVVLSFGMLQDQVSKGNQATTTITITDNNTSAVSAELLSALEVGASRAAVGNAANGTGICDRTEAVRVGLLDLVGKIYPTVANCADVTNDHLAAVIDSLDLSDSGIESLKADDFSGLTNLTTLYLSRNQLSALPESVFADLASLEYLNLSYNQLSVLPAGLFSGLTNLTTLYLSRNQLSALPESVFADLASLEYLNLSYNQLRVLPVGLFSGLTNLTVLHLSRNQLSALPERVFAGLTSLKDLDLWQNQLRTLPAGVFSGLTSLDDLDLERNELQTLPAGVFSGLSLRFLGLEDNELSTLPAGVFANLNITLTLDLSHNRLHTLPASVFAGLANLPFLDLSVNQLGELPSGLLSGLTSLTSLWIDQNPGSPFIFTMTPERIPGTNKVVVTVAYGAPFSMTTTISTIEGTTLTSVYPVMVPAGRVASDEIVIDSLGVGAKLAMGMASSVPMFSQFIGIKTAVCSFNEEDFTLD